MKLVSLARESVRLLKESGDKGIRSDVLSEKLNVPKRRIYDVVAVLKALNAVKTKRRFDGTTITWIDQFRNYVPLQEHLEYVENLEELHTEKRNLQLQLAQSKEQLRVAKSRIRSETISAQSQEKTQFNTTQLRIRRTNGSGFKKVTDTGIEVLVETSEPGMIVDPSETDADDNEALLRSLQRI